MQTAPPIHPNRRELADFGLGKLHPEDGETVNRHLQFCEECRQIVIQTPPDEFLENLRAGYSGRLESMAAKQSGPSVPAAGAEQNPDPRGNSITRVLAAASSPSSASQEHDEARSGSTSGFPPELLDHPNYRLIRQIGRGGMGSVYLAVNLLLDRREVLKVVARANVGRPAVVQRFEQEIRAAARLHHPNIVTAFNAFEAGKSLVFAMEYVDGKDLSLVVEQLGPLPITKAAYYSYQTALGLQAAHDAKMVHRDIKPSNLMLSQTAKKHIIIESDLVNGKFLQAQVSRVEE